MTGDRPQPNRRSIRLKGYHYSQEGAYFVTICTRGHVSLFEDDVIRSVAEECWLGIPDHFPNVALDEWVVMPNHLHGILIISGDRGGTIRRGTACRAPTPTSERYGRPTPGSLATIMRSFKAAVTRRINALRGTPGERFWQRNYYERIIRYEDELRGLRRYVLDNPVQWETDADNPAVKADAVSAVGAPAASVRETLGNPHRGELTCQPGSAR